MKESAVVTIFPNPATIAIPTAHFSEGSYIITVSYEKDAPVSKKLAITHEH